MKTYVNPVVYFNAESDLFIFQDVEWIPEGMPVKSRYYYMQDYCCTETNQQAVFYFSDAVFYFSDNPVMIKVLD